MEEKEERELLVAKFLIGNLNSNATGMINKSEPFEAYPSQVSGETGWNLLR